MESLQHELDDLDLWERRAQQPDARYDKGKAPLEPAGPSAADGDAGQQGGDSGSDAGDLTCAICLGGIPLENLALVKGCEHMYCATCILHWALHKESEVACPQCKAPFTHLITYRALDGTLQDYPSEESVTLLRRARWLEDHVRRVEGAERGSALVADAARADDTAWQDYADDYELASDEEIEAFYYSSAAGRARVTLGNRRFGGGGFLSTGRRQARPLGPGHRAGGGSKMPKAGEQAAVGTPPAAASVAALRTPNGGGGRRANAGASQPLAPSSVPPLAAARADGAGSSRPASLPRCGSALGSELYGSSPGVGSAMLGSSPSGSGRRARRNARRVAQDADLTVHGF